MCIRDSCYALVQQRANGGLYIERVAPQAIDRIDVDHVTLARIGQQARESRPLCGCHRTTHAFVRELVAELLGIGLGEHRVTLRSDGLLRARDTEVGEV